MNDGTLDQMRAFRPPGLHRDLILPPRAILIIVSVTGYSTSKLQEQPVILIPTAQSNPL